MSVSYKIAGLALAGLFNTLAAGTALAADLEIANPWVRGTVASQKATGAFMQLTSKGGVSLVGVASPAASIVEIHEMADDNGVMVMRPLADGLTIPAGSEEVLEPGGYHVMLMDLQAQVKEGDAVPLTLVVENKDGSRQTLEVTAPARALNAPMKMQHGKH